MSWGVKRYTARSIAAPVAPPTVTSHPPRSNVASLFHSKFLLFLQGECLEKYKGGGYKHASKYNNAKACVDGGGEWFEFNNFLEEVPQYNTEADCKAARTPDKPLFWGRPYRSQDLDTKQPQKKCLVGLDKPHCELASWSRDNHLGNGRDGVPLNYTWVLPHFPSGKTQRCIFRLR